MRKRHLGKMSSEQRLALGLTLGGLLMAAGALGASGTSELGRTRDLSEQIKLDIARSIHANATAMTALEWQKSGYAPAEIFQNVRDFKINEAAQALCDGLNVLTDTDLALFEDEIADEKNARVVPCAATLQDRLKQYWISSRNELAEISTSEFPERAFSRSKVKLQLPSIEVPVDAAAGPLLIRGGLKKGEIALTFDDGPHPKRTARLLEILANAGVRATFFQVGEMTTSYPEISKQVAEAGHMVGSHTFTHPQLPKLSAKDAESEIRSGREAVALASGTDIPFFRFPYGARNTYLNEFIKSQGMASFLWNMDSADWKLRDPKVLLARVKAQLDHEQGGIILFHDIHEQTVIALPYVLEELRARGFTTVVYVPQR